MSELARIDGSTNLKYQAESKDDRCQVTGYYFQMNGRHFIISNDASLWEYHTRDVLTGFVEIRWSTLKKA